MTIGQRLKSRREELNLTQGYVANKVGVAIQTIYKYENEIVTNIPLDRLELLAFALDVSPAYLMGWVDDAEVEKKNDTIAGIILKLRSDSELLNMIKDICELSPEQQSAVQNLIFAFNNNK